MIYLDSAAVVKLAHAEPESPALRSWLKERTDTGWISSVLTEIESFRARDGVADRGLDLGVLPPERIGVSLTAGRKRRIRRRGRGARAGLGRDRSPRTGAG